MSLSPLARPETTIATEAQIDLWSALPIQTLAVQFPKNGLFPCAICYGIAGIGVRLTEKRAGSPDNGKGVGLRLHWGAISLDMPLS